MKKTIYKYGLTARQNQTVDLPKGAEILAVQNQHGNGQLWAIVDKEERETEKRQIEIFATGEPIPDGERDYISTIQFGGGTLVYHVFEKL